MENKYVNVCNKSGGLVVYTTPTFGRRQFYAGQHSKVSVEELKELVQLPGGITLFMNFL